MSSLGPIFIPDFIMPECRAGGDRMSNAGYGGQLVAIIFTAHPRKG